MDESKYKHVQVPSITFLNELLNKAVFGGLSKKEQGLLGHYGAMVTEGKDMGDLHGHPDILDFHTFGADVQAVMLKSANTGAWLEWNKQYDEECAANRAARKEMDMPKPL